MTSRDLESLRDWFNERAATRMLSMRCEPLKPGRAVLTMDPPAEVGNPNGAVNGGLIAALADQAGGIAVSTRLDRDEYAATAQLDVHFLRPLLATPARAEATVRRRGRRLAFPNVEIRDADGELCALATGTWSVEADTRHPYG
jgi:uncharacterized protein (TIGR00369 family)